MNRDPINHPDAYASYDAQSRMEVIALIGQQAKKIAELETALVDARAEVATWRAQREAVVKLHRRRVDPDLGQPFCAECTEYLSASSWPCHTAQELCAGQET